MARAVALWLAVALLGALAACGSRSGDLPWFDAGGADGGAGGAGGGSAGR
jgi:hypothetical protein